MAEIEEAVQIAEIIGKGLVGVGSIAVKTTEIGINIIKAILSQIDKVRHEKLIGEVTLDKLNRFEGGQLSVCRFENIEIDQLRPLLDQFGVPYAVMPDADINGIHYTQVSFGKHYADRMNAVLQTLGGRGEIITPNTQPTYINSGEVAYHVLLEQDQSIMICQFDESLKEQAKEYLAQYGVKFSELPDLNLKDGKAEIAFPPKHQMLVQTMLNKWQHGTIISYEDYTNNAEKDTAAMLAAEYDRNHLEPDQFDILAETDEVVTLRVPRMKLILTEPERDPLVAPTNSYAIPIPQTSIKDDPVDQAKIQIDIRKKEEYATILPSGDAGDKKKGSDILAELQALLEERKKAEEARKAAVPIPEPHPVEIHEKSRTL